MQISENNISWMKTAGTEDLVFLGKDVVASFSGFYIKFFDFITKTERVERFHSKERGEGVSCLAGHPGIAIFAVAERRLKPKIRIFSYPFIHKVSECRSYEAGTKNGILSCTFAGTDYLLSLGTFPNFQLTVWFWRNGDVMTFIDTRISDTSQKISCSSFSPYVTSQFGKTSGELDLYEIYVCSKMVKLLPLKLGNIGAKIISSTFTPENDLLVYDEFSNIYLLNTDGEKILQMRLDAHSEKNGSRNPAGLAFFQNGLVFINSKSEINFYRKLVSSHAASTPMKSSSAWKLINSIKSTSHPICMTTHTDLNFLLIRTARGEVCKLQIQNNEVLKLETIYLDGTNYKHLEWVNPSKSHFVVVDEFNWLKIYRVDGSFVESMNLSCHGKVQCLTSHPKLPVLVYGTKTGNCVFVNSENVFAIKHMKCLHLHENSIDAIKFSQTGETLALGSFLTGDLFLVKSNFDEEICVIAYIAVASRILDFLVYEGSEYSEKIFKVLVLIATNSMAKVGDSIIVYEVEENKISCNKIRSLIQLPNFYKHLCYGFQERQILGTPYLSKLLHFFEIQMDFQNVTLKQVEPSKHELRNIKISTTNEYLITTGYDGLVVFRDRQDVGQVLGIFMAQHRHDFGSGRAIVSKDSIISLGRNGNLVAIKFSSRDRLSNEREVTGSISALAGTQSGISCSVLGGLEDENSDTWLDQQASARLRHERLQSGPIRARILQDLQKIRHRIADLLDENEKEDEASKLPIVEFDLDKKTRYWKIEASKKERRLIKRNLEEEIHGRNELIKFLRETCWDVMETNSKSLVSIFDDIRVDNYAIRKQTEDEMNQNRWMQLQIELQRYLENDENVDLEDKDTTGEDLFLEMKDEIRLNGENPFILIGTSTHKFLEDRDFASSNQLLRRDEYCKVEQQNFLGRSWEDKLQKSFNENFEKMRANKEQEISRVKGRIDMLTHCQSELKSFFGIDSSIEIPDVPTWCPIERPEDIIVVEEPEILSKMTKCDLSNEGCSRKLSVSSPELFYHQALDGMMDGVLETKWEEEIKKDIPKPDCIFKNPWNRSEEENTIISNYEKKVQNLESDRQKYKVILETEISETRAILQRDIDTFNSKLNNMRHEKMQIEAAILQEKLMRLRMSTRHNFILQKLQEIRHVERRQLKKILNDGKNTNEVMYRMETIIIELRNRYDHLLRREKTMDVKFKSEFPDLKQPMLEHLLRNFKKRPRQLVCTSIVYLNEICKCILSNDTTVILPKDSWDFLCALKVLDIMPNNLPPQIDANHWMLLCKLRRAKIEMEIRIRIATIELTEAEQTYSSYQKISSTIQKRISDTKSHLDKLKSELTAFRNNMEIQLILKMGQIETQLYGSPNDLANSIFITYAELHEINRNILQNGSMKIQAMKETLGFRSTILSKEWQHRCMKMTMKDLNEDIKVLQAFKVTKQIQEYLKSHCRLPSPEKDAEVFQRNLMSYEKKLQRNLKEERQKLGKVIKEVLEWQERNDSLLKTLETLKAENQNDENTLKDNIHEKHRNFIKKQLLIIMKKNRWMLKIEENYEELISLHTQLELMKLKTYPTLKFKGKQTTND